MDVPTSPQRLSPQKNGHTIDESPDSHFNGPPSDFWGRDSQSYQLCLFFMPWATSHDAFRFPSQIVNHQRNRHES